MVPSVIQHSKHLYIGLVALVIVGVGLLLLALNWSASTQQFNPKLTDQYNLEFSYNLELKNASFEEVINADFIPAALNIIPVSFGDHHHWYKIRLSNPFEFSESFRLIVDNPLVDQLTLYQLENDELTALLTIGDRLEGVTLKNRILANHPFTLAVNEEQTFWINIQTNGSPLVPINILQETNFIEYLTVLHLIWGAFCAVTLVIAVYNLVLYIGLRDNAYLYYVMYLTAMLLLLGGIHGFGYYLFPMSVQLFISKYIALFQALVSLLALQFGATFLNINYKSGAIFVAKQVVFYLLVLFSISTLFLAESITTRIFTVLQSLVYISIGMMVFWKFKERFIWSRYYLVSWMPIFIGGAVVALLYAGLLDYNFLTRHALLFSVIVEIALISTALADRMGALEKLQLYNATHDMKSGLANDFYLKKFLEYKKIKGSGAMSVIAMKITNSNVIYPYLKQDNQKSIILALSQKIISQLEVMTALSVLNEPLKIKNVIINNDQLVFVLPVHKLESIVNILISLSEDENTNPLRDDIPFRLQCVYAARILKDKQYNPQSIINDLQQCLNYAVETKKNYCIYHDKMNESNLRDVRLAYDLEQAIANNELELYHQPQLVVNDEFNLNQCSEVLVRWQHPDLGNIPPDEFVLIAEQTGLIKQLTQWVIHHAFMQHNIINERLNINTHVSINVSANDFSRTGFYEEVISLVQTLNVDPSNFTLEVTETSHQDDTYCFHKNINQLKKQGFNLAIDDFGTGYSSLTYVSDLPFNELKIDRSFVKDLLKSQRQHKIINATIQMAINLGLNVTAEGIEDEDTLLELIKLKCHKIQGYFFAKPMNFNDYQTWIEKGEGYIVDSNTLNALRAQNDPFQGQFNEGNKLN